VMHYAIDNKWQWVDGISVAELENTLSTKKRRSAR